VLIDDKVRILAAFREQLQARVTTVFPRQGHYALDVRSLAAYPAADVTIERIADLLDVEAASLFTPRYAR
jgi:predicted nuclease of predicted toxin-antitoxin system